MTTATLSTDQGERQGQPLTAWNAWRVRHNHFAGKCGARNRRFSSRPPRTGMAGWWCVLPSLLSDSLSVVAAPPREQIGGKIRGRLPHMRRARRDRTCIRIDRDRLAIEMPGGVAAQRNDHGE